MRPRLATPDDRARRRPLGARVGLVLACVAILAYLAQIGHFAAVAHVVGDDGYLHHARGSAATPVAHRAAADRVGSDHGDAGSEDPGGGAPGTADPDEDLPGEGEPCPLQPPGLEPCAQPDVPDPRPRPAPEPPADPRPAAAPILDDVLSLAPKHSPPTHSRS